MDPYVLNNYQFMAEVNGGLSLVACIHSSRLSVCFSVFFFWGLKCRYCNIPAAPWLRIMTQQQYLVGLEWGLNIQVYIFPEQLIRWSCTHKYTPTLNYYSKIRTKMLRFKLMTAMMGSNTVPCSEILNQMQHWIWFFSFFQYSLHALLCDRLFRSCKVATRI